jgi:hypothetical protein
MIEDEPLGSFLPMEKKLFVTHETPIGTSGRSEGVTARNVVELIKWRDYSVSLI